MVPAHPLNSLRLTSNSGGQTNEAQQPRQYSILLIVAKSMRDTCIVKLNISTHTQAGTVCIRVLRYCQQGANVPGPQLRHAVL